MFDVLIVGSGPSGTHAALAAVAAGARVGMIDAGDPDDGPDRASEPPPSDLSAGVHLDANQMYMVRDASSLFPIDSDSFFPMQATSLGGLGVAWGANCFALTERELERVGLPAAAMRPHYDDVVREVGISGPPADALSDEVANVDRALLAPALPLDDNARALLRRHERQPDADADDRRFLLGQGLLAKTDGHPEYRPAVSLRALQQHDNFTLLPGRLAVSFVDHGAHVDVTTRGRTSRVTEEFAARKTLLACGAINSARLALGSLGLRGQRQPLLCNRNHWIAAVNLALLGRRAAPGSDAAGSRAFAQLTAMVRSDDGGADLVAQTYSYSRHERLAPHVPLPRSLAMGALQLVGAALTMVNVHFTDRPSPNRWLAVNDRDVVQVEAQFSATEEQAFGELQRRLMTQLRRLRCVPLRVRVPAFGASLHYAGTLPYSTADECEQPGTTRADGVLAGTNNVYVADGSTWRMLPAKGPTLTLMANARRVAMQAVATL